VTRLAARSSARAAHLAAHSSAWATRLMVRAAHLMARCDRTGARNRSGTDVVAAVGHGLHELFVHAHTHICLGLACLVM
jgi:hypothetical protein